MAEGILQRKLAAQAAQAAEGAPGADRAWRLALARAARDLMALRLDIRRLTADRRSLAELLELPPERALIAMLEGPGEGLGVIILSPAVLAGIIEMQTMGRVSSNAAPARRPTRTDAAMVADFIDGALVRLEQALAEEADLIWAGGFRYASFLDDARPLGLLLEDADYRVMSVEAALGDGAKAGPVILALPAAGRGVRPVPKADPGEAALAGPAFTAALSEQVLAADCELRAVLCKMSLPLKAMLALAPGDCLTLPAAGVDRIAFEALDGRKLAEGRLGQNRGMRAVKLGPPTGQVIGLATAEARHDRRVTAVLATGT